MRWALLAEDTCYRQRDQQRFISGVASRIMQPSRASLSWSFSLPLLVIGQMFTFLHFSPFETQGTHIVPKWSVRIAGATREWTNPSRSSQSSPEKTQIYNYLSCAGLVETHHRGDWWGQQLFPPPPNPPFGINTISMPSCCGSK